MPYDRFGRFYPAAGSARPTGAGAPSVQRRQSIPVPPQPDYGEWLRQRGQQARDYRQRYYDSLSGVRDAVFAPIGTYSLLPQSVHSRIADAARPVVEGIRDTADWMIESAATPPWALPPVEPIGVPRWMQRTWEQMPRYEPPLPVQALANQWGSALQGRPSQGEALPTDRPYMPMVTRGDAPVTVTIYGAGPPPYNPWNEYGDSWRGVNPWGEWGW